MPEQARPRQNSNTLAKLDIEAIASFIKILLAARESENTVFSLVTGAVRRHRAIS